MFLESFTEHGQPWHGLAVDGVLTTPAGPKTIAGDGGAIVVRHPMAPGVNRTPEQLANDAALGQEWRDYALLCGSARAVDGGQELGANAWLYCAGDGRTWVMTVEKTYTAGAVATFEIWRRDLFGNFRTPPHQVSDEKVGEVVVTFTLPPEYAGAITAAQVAADAAVNLAAAIVPNPAGSSVFLHVLSQFEEVYPATYVAIGGLGRAAAAIIECTLSGNGDVASQGVGVVAAFPVVEHYATLRIETDTDLHVGASLSSLSPPWDDCSGTIDPDPPPNPASAGLTYVQHEDYSPTWDGSTHVWQTSSASKNRRATVYRTHHGDVVVARKHYNLQRREYTISGGSIRKTITYVSVANDPPPGFHWEEQSVVYDATKYHTEIESDTGQTDGYVEYGQALTLAFGAISVGDSWEWRDGYTVRHFALDATGSGWCTTGWPYSLPADVHTAEHWASTFGALSNGMSIFNIDMDGGVQIFPGYIVFRWWRNNPNNDGNRSLFWRFVGIGESAGALFASYDMQNPTGVWPPAYNQMPETHAFQPATGVGTYALGGVHNNLQYC